MVLSVTRVINEMLFKENYSLCRVRRRKNVRSLIYFDAVKTEEKFPIYYPGKVFGTSLRFSRRLLLKFLSITFEFKSARNRGTINKRFRGFWLLHAQLDFIGVVSWLLRVVSVSPLTCYIVQLLCQYFPFLNQRPLILTARSPLLRSAVDISPSNYSHRCA